MNKYRVTFSFIDSYLCSWTEEDIYEGRNMNEAFKNAWHDAKNGEYKSDFLDIIKIEMIEEEN